MDSRPVSMVPLSAVRPAEPANQARLRDPARLGGHGAGGLAFGLHWSWSCNRWRNPLQAGDDRLSQCDINRALRGDGTRCL